MIAIAVCMCVVVVVDDGDLPRLVLLACMVCVMIIYIQYQSLIEGKDPIIRKPSIGGAVSLTDFLFYYVLYRDASIPMHPS